MTIESSSPTVAKQPTPTIKKANPQKKQPSTARRKVQTKPAASDSLFVDSQLVTPKTSNPDADVNLFAEVSEPQEKYEGFICPICKGNMDSAEDLLKHQPFCPGVRDGRGRQSASDVCLPTYTNTVCPYRYDVCLSSVHCAHVALNTRSLSTKVSIRMDFVLQCCPVIMMYTSVACIKSSPFYYLARTLHSQPRAG